MKQIYCFEINKNQFYSYKQKSANIFLIEDNKQARMINSFEYIAFEKQSNNLRKTPILCYVKNIYYFLDIKEAVATFGTKKCGFAENMSIEQVSDLFLNNKSVVRIEKLGIVAIEFEFKK